MKRVAILGSTGSVGQNALRVLLGLKETHRPVALVARKNAEALAEQIRTHHVRAAGLLEAEAAERLIGSGGLNGTKVVGGDEQVLELLDRSEVDLVMQALVSGRGLRFSLETVKRGIPLAIANKESLVMAGGLLMAEAKKNNVPILPVDSEHSAVFQLLRDQPMERVKQITLTASGGPFFQTPDRDLSTVTKEEALTHPNWKMGPKITVDSATMMNKALEVIEAVHLFSLPPSKVKVVIHPQSIVHALVEFEDGSVLAHLGVPDMRIPIQYALTHPDRSESGVEPLDLTALSRLDFLPPDSDRFPALALGYQVAEAGGTSGAVLNAANEVAVERFLNDEISFPQIVETVARVLSSHQTLEEPDLPQILDADRWAREEAARG